MAPEKGIKGRRNDKWENKNDKGKLIRKVNENNKRLKKKEVRKKAEKTEDWEKEDFHTRKTIYMKENYLKSDRREKSKTVDVNE